MTPLVEKQVAARAEKDRVSTAEAKNRLLLEKQPSGEMAMPEQVRALNVYTRTQAHISTS